MKSGNFWISLKNALAGIGYCFKNERNFKIHLCMAVLALGMAFFAGVNQTELLFIILAIFFVIVSEIFNTAVESWCNMVSMEYNKYTKIAKDCAAAAVLVSAINAAVIGAIIFLPKLISKI